MYLASMFAADPYFRDIFSSSPTLVIVGSTFIIWNEHIALNNTSSSFECSENSLMKAYPKSNLYVLS